MRALFFIAVFLFVSSVSSYQTTEAPKKDCSDQFLKQCTTDLLKFSADDIEVPKTEEEVLDNCAVIKNGTRCIRRYMTTCVPGVIRQMTKMAMAGVSRTINKRCSPEGVQTFLSHRECIVAVKKPAQDCYRDLVRNMYRIRAKNDLKLLHPSVCCFISKMHECNSNALKENCKEESQEYYGQETGKLMDEMMELICPPNLRWGKKDCDDVDAALPSDVEIPDDKDLSILPLVLDLVKQLAE